MARPEHLPLELLETFVAIAKLEGNAAAAAKQLEISQPSISKRLAALRRATSEPDGQAWLLLKGRRWKLTAEGQRVQGVVTDLVHRYAELERFVSSDRQSRSFVSIACGQEGASGFVKAAIERLIKDQPNARIRISTPRGKVRIEGVAGGQFDLAVVTDSPATIRQIARVDLHIHNLFDDQFVLVANPAAKSGWAEKWNALPTDRPIMAKELVAFPFILPEPDASRRRQFDEWSFRASAQPFDVILETGGWQTILEYTNSGLGVGLVTLSSLEGFQSRRATKLNYRLLSTKEFPPDAVRLIARKAHGKNEPELTEAAKGLYEALKVSS
jgi:LysR family positive regulator for ilvC